MLEANGQSNTSVAGDSFLAQLDANISATATILSDICLV